MLYFGAVSNQCPQGPPIREISHLNVAVLEGHLNQSYLEREVKTFKTAQAVWMREVTLDDAMSIESSVFSFCPLAISASTP